MLRFGEPMQNSLLLVALKMIRNPILLLENDVIPFSDPPAKDWTLAAVAENDELGTVQRIAQNKIIMVHSLNNQS